MTTFADDTAIMATNATIDRITEFYELNNVVNNWMKKCRIKLIKIEAAHHFYK